jgi:hypothetical protein
MRPLSRRQLAVIRLTLKDGLADRTVSVRPKPAFNISMHLENPNFRHWGRWVAGKFLKVKSWVHGGIGIYDLESDPVSYRPTPFDAVRA